MRCNCSPVEYRARSSKNPSFLGEAALVSARTLAYDSLPILKASSIAGKSPGAHLFIELPNTSQHSVPGRFEVRRQSGCLLAQFLDGRHGRKHTSVQLWRKLNCSRHTIAIVQFQLELLLSARINACCWQCAGTDPTAAQSLREGSHRAFARAGHRSGPGPAYTLRVNL